MEFNYILIQGTKQAEYASHRHNMIQHIKINLLNFTRIPDEINSG